MDGSKVFELAEEVIGYGSIEPRRMGAGLAKETIQRLVI
jgi:hypothetical protein